MSSNICLRQSMHLDELITNTFTDIYIKYKYTFRFIKVQWSELNNYMNTHQNNVIDLYFLRYINTIKNISEPNEINNICYDTYYSTHTDNEIISINDDKNTQNTQNIIAIFSQIHCIQMFKILVMIYKLHPEWNWIQTQDYLTVFWVDCRNKYNRYSNLLPLKIRFYVYTFKDESIIPIIPLYIDIKTLEELRIIIISNIDWDNMEKLEFQLYNNDCIINISFNRLNKFNTIIHGIFSVYLNPLYKTKTLIKINEMIDINKITNNFNILDKYVEILTVNTTHNCISVNRFSNKQIIFSNMEFSITTKSMYRITNFSLNIIEMYLQFFKDVYKIDLWKIRKRCD